MAAYRRVYDSRRLQADCQEPGSAPEPATTFQTFIVSLVLSRLDYGNAVLAGLPAYLFRRFSRRWTRQHGSSNDLRPASLRPHHRRTHQPPLAPGSRESAVQDGRVHVQGHPWNCAVIPESTGSCRRSAWTTFPPLCSDQSSAGAVRETVYRRPPGLPGRRTHHLEQPIPDSVISAPYLSTFRQRLKTFLFQASLPDIITDPR